MERIMIFPLVESGKCGTRASGRKITHMTVKPKAALKRRRSGYARRIARNAAEASQPAAIAIASDISPYQKG